MGAQVLDEELSALLSRYEVALPPRASRARHTCDLAAKDKKTGRAVRILLAPNLEPESGLRVLYELVLCRRAQHPGIPRVLYAKVSAKGLAAALSQPDGATLATLFQKAGGRLDEKKALRLAAEMAGVVRAVHAAQLLLLTAGLETFRVDRERKQLCLANAGICLPLESATARRRLEDVTALELRPNGTMPVPTDVPLVEPAPNPSPSPLMVLHRSMSSIRPPRQWKPPGPCWPRRRPRVRTPW